MFKVQKITSYPLQKKTLNLPDGSQVRITLAFIPMQLCWVIKELTYKDFTLNSYTVVTGLNILRQFRNIIPFGIAVKCKENRDPVFVEDFQSEKAEMFLLSKEECQQVEDFLSGKVQ
ncbi:hypothetical protein phi1422_0061 [Bdellovibrio phage phi1422]|uniref:hypothetical protein n=1 Tax=Bdellovibrio phage phi1422 TaxID=1127515 RepID=UPI0002536D71|nr:hypothetical protein F395_gp61 [Bdellovibrio phage phi1422]AFC22581.1 hypothetical protein phi1422_0061 [Bdellovibrio phage phi1422]